MNKNGKDSGAGRPFKQKIWVEKLKEVLTEEDTRFLTDEDLVFLVNQRLEKIHRIDKRTFKNWKAGKFHQDDEVGEEFIELIEFVLIKQKQGLLSKIIDTENDKFWYRYAWLAERKFNELNLKKITETKNTNSQEINIQISAADNEQMKLIDSIINPLAFTDYKEVEPKILPSKDIDESTDNEKEDEMPF